MSHDTLKVYQLVASSKASQIELKITRKVCGRLGFWFWPCQLWSWVGHCSFLLHFAVALGFGIGGPWGSCLALRAYEFKRAKSTCEPCGKNGHDDSCSLKDHFNSWHVYLTFFKMEKYRKESIWYSHSVRVRSEPDLPYGLPEAEQEKTRLCSSFSPPSSTFQRDLQPWSRMLYYEGYAGYDR